MRTKAEIQVIELYLSDVDQYLVSRGVDPRERLGYIGEAADALLQPTAGSPIEEFGQPKNYARELALALGVTRRRAWWRLLALFAGTWVVAMCLTSLLVHYLPFGQDRLDGPLLVAPFLHVPTALAVTFAAWSVMTPSGVRAAGAGRSVKERIARIAGLTIGLIVALVGWFNLVVRTTDLEFELASSPVILPVLGLGVVAGLALIWQSRCLHTVIALMATSRQRHDSNIIYHPLALPSVKVFDRNSPALDAASAQPSDGSVSGRSGPGAPRGRGLQASQGTGTQ